jgi:dienelactone hydrolase
MRNLAIAVAVTLTAALAAAQDAPAPAHETIFYRSGSLNLEAYVYTPPGKGPFPLVVYNHGSRAGQERTEWPVAFIARWLVPEGFAVMVPERRGYGKSEGATFSDEIGADRGERFVQRMEEEAADVNAAVIYAKARLPIDPQRIMTIGYSFGGIVTTLAASESTSFMRIVNQAPGALNWGKSEPLRQALVAAAGKIRAPMLCMAAENDATIENARALCAAAKANGARVSVKIYPPFTTPRAANAAAPGHALFAPVGIDIWKADVLSFLRTR